MDTKRKVKEEDAQANTENVTTEKDEGIPCGADNVNGKKAVGVDEKGMGKKPMEVEEINYPSDHNFSDEYTFDPLNLASKLKKPMADRGKLVIEDDVGNQKVTSEPEEAGNTHEWGHNSGATQTENFRKKSDQLFEFLQKEGEKDGILGAFKRGAYNRLWADFLTKYDMFPATVSGDSSSGNASGHNFSGRDTSDLLNFAPKLKKPKADMGTLVIQDDAGKQRVSSEKAGSTPKRGDESAAVQKEKPVFGGSGRSPRAQARSEEHEIGRGNKGIDGSETDENVIAKKSTAGGTPDVKIGPPKTEDNGDKVKAVTSTSVRMEEGENFLRNDEKQKGIESKKGNAKDGKRGGKSEKGDGPGGEEKSC